MTADDTLERTDLHEFLGDRLTYPISLTAVREQLGDTMIVAPDDDESRTVGDLLDDNEDETYESVEELYQTIVSRLPDAYIGRKFYDDRGPTIQDVAGKDDESL